MMTLKIVKSEGAPAV